MKPYILTPNILKPKIKNIIGPVFILNIYIYISNSVSSRSVS